jgi:hypothetical protein
MAMTDECEKTPERPCLPNECSVAEIYKWIRRHGPPEGVDMGWMEEGAQEAYGLYQRQFVQGEYAPEPLTRFQYACLLLLVDEVVPKADVGSFVTVLNSLLVLPLPVQAMARCDLKAGTFHLDERIEVTERGKDRTVFKLPADLIP